MEVLKFFNENKNLTYENIKNILEDKYKLKLITDKTNNYYMICTTDNSNFNDIFIRQCTGVILEKGTNKILHYFGEKTYDVDNKYNNNVINLKDINIKNCYITKYVNGYIIKTFNYKGKWMFATSKHTNIKYFNIKNKNIKLYNIFKNYILKTFDKIEDFLNLLDKNYCYTFILTDNYINLINKVNLSNLEQHFNLNSYISLSKYKYFNKNFNKNDKDQNFLIIEINKNSEVIKKIHISTDNIKKILYDNFCKYNDKCFNKSCKLIHIIEPDIEENYKEYIKLKRKINPLFKTKKCTNGDNCTKNMENKCIFIHENDSGFL